MRNKLIVNFSLVILLGVFLQTLVGIYLIDNAIINQTQEKVRLDLNSAREVLREECMKLRLICQLIAGRSLIRNAILFKKPQLYREVLSDIMQTQDCELVTLYDVDGKILYRAHNPDVAGDIPDDEIIRKTLNTGKTNVASRIVSSSEMEREGKDYLARSTNKSFSTDKLIPIEKNELGAGMVIQAASPVKDEGGRVIGALACGILLNHNYKIVDKVKEMVYKEQKYMGKDMGTATIFQGAVRISTNVRNQDGSRAIGTQVSKEVYQRVIVEGKSWIDRAFVVNDWYITAYEPIVDLKSNIIGMLYVGVLEAPYQNVKNRVFFTFLVIAILMVIILWSVAYLSTSYITRPIKKLLTATNCIAKGDLSCRVEIDTKDEIGLLAESFNNMSEKLENSSEKVLSLNRTLEEKVRKKSQELELAQDQLIQSEKLTSLGKMAAGIAHEINNPLTSVLINSHLAAEELKILTGIHGKKKLEMLYDNIEFIIEETTRCSTIVKELLEFSRQKTAEKKPCKISDIIEKNLLLFEGQFLISKIKVEKKLESADVIISIDQIKMEQVFNNIIHNAIDAMPQGGDLTILTSLENNWLKIIFRDSGTGIEKENLTKIFDPFFTTKGNKGTGLGLSLSYGIVCQHDGKIKARSEKESGMEIIIEIPV